MEYSNLLRERHRPVFPVGAFFKHASNAHCYKTMQFSDCHCVIDGSALPHVLWRLTPHWKLSDEAQFAVIVENFFRSFLRAGITVHVLFLCPTQNIRSSDANAYNVVYRRIKLLDSNEWKAESSMQSRVIFSEVMKALGIRHFIAMGDYGSMASYARSIDAFVISENNFFFFANLPRGCVLTRNLPLEQLHRGLMNICAETYFREDFIRNLKTVEDDKMRLIALFATLVHSDYSDINAQLVRTPKHGAKIDGIEFSRNQYLCHLARCLSFVTKVSDARLRIHSLMYPDRRKLFQQMCEMLYMDFEAPEQDCYEVDDSVPILREFLECDARRDWSTSADEETSEDGESDEEDDAIRDLSEDDERLPGWFKTAVQSEVSGGYWGNRFQRLIALMGTGCFYPIHHLQNPNDYSACIASLRTRRVLYGIMFQDYRKQLLDKGDDAAVDLFQVEEMIVIYQRIFDLRISPVWCILDAVNPHDPIRLPSLLEMKSLDLDTRRRIFAVAMVGDSEWLMNLGPDATNYEYNLLLLRSWAKRSPDLQKVHVVVLLLTILAIQTEYKKQNRFFPWPISFRKEKTPRCPEKSAGIHYEYLQPFGQLQSVTDTASYLNCALNFPHGARVDSVREFYSEIFYHNLLDDWISLTEEEQAACLVSLFDDEGFENFSRLVDALYGDEDEAERAPLYMLLSEDGLSSHEIMGTAFYFPDDDSDSDDSTREN